MRKVAGKLRLELSQYRELEAFAQFGSELDADTQATLARGERLVEALNQDERDPWKIEDQVAAIYSGTGGFLDRIKTERINDFHHSMLQRLHAEKSELMTRLAQGEWGDEIEKELGDSIAEAVDDFGADFDAEGNPVEEGESDRLSSERAREAGGAGGDGAQAPTGQAPIASTEGPAPTDAVGTADGSAGDVVDESADVSAEETEVVDEPGPDEQVAARRA
jgi:F-type H+-transporting ATPase subunit alpha